MKLESQARSATLDEAASGVLMLVCTETGGEVDTGVHYTRHELTRTTRVMVHEQCPFCRQVHLFKFSEARLTPKAPEDFRASETA